MIKERLITMKAINDCIVFSNDIKRILDGYNATNFDYRKVGMNPPSKEFLQQLRQDFEKDVNRIFNNQTLILSEENMLEGIEIAIADVFWRYPIISLDKIYLQPDEKHIIFLDATRLNGSSTLVSRNHIQNPNYVNEQIQIISEKLIQEGSTDIVLADDVVFSGVVLANIIEKFQQNNIHVIGIRSGISTSQAYTKFSQALPLGLKCGYLLEENVIDQICERDFYFGIAQSGISVMEGLEVWKAPYFKPFGNPVERASIPPEFEIPFSNGCIERSISLWKEIEKNSESVFYIRDLPEKIYGTNPNQEIVKTLKKGKIKL